MQPRVVVFDEIRDERSRPGEWCLTFQHVRYLYETGETQDGFRFIWRRPDNSLQPARGQARIPDLESALRLIHHAVERNWGPTGAFDVVENPEFKQHADYAPVEIKGEPLSETILQERR
jgi:hypothetical protein